MGYTTLLKVQEEIRATRGFATNTNPSSTTVLQWIEQESAKVNEFAQREFIGTTKVDFIDYKGQETFMLKYSPILSVTSVEYNTSRLGEAESWVTLTPTTQYIVYTDTAEIMPVTRNIVLKEGHKNIKVTYIPGYTTVPLVIELLTTKLVALRVLNTLIQEKANQSTAGAQIKIGDVSIKEPTSFGVQSYTALKNEIDDLKKELAKTDGVYRYGGY